MNACWNRGSTRSIQAGQQRAGTFTQAHRPQGGLAVRWASLLQNPFVNSATLFRRELFRRFDLGYDVTLFPTEDYDLWARALVHCEGDNLAEPLVQYRRHPEQATATQRLLQLEIHDRIATRTIRESLPRDAFVSDDVTNMRRIFVGGGDGHCDPVSATRSYLDLFDAFASVHAGHPELCGVKRGVTARATLALVSSGRDKAVAGLMVRILRMEPTIPLRALRSVARRALHVRGGPAR